MARKRDYKAEYARRVARGLAKGYSRSQARGHPTTSEAHLSPRVRPVAHDPLLEQGLKSMRQGHSLSAAARRMGKSPETLRRYLTRAGVIEKQGRRWVTARDDRARQVAFYSDGKVKSVMVADYQAAALVGGYMAAVKQFLLTNDVAFLESYEGIGITDASGQSHSFETRPNVLYRLDASDSEPFEQVYRIVM